MPIEHTPQNHTQRFLTMRQQLLGADSIHQEIIGQAAIADKKSSFVIWPSQRNVSKTDFQEVTLWSATQVDQPSEQPRILPLTIERADKLAVPTRLDTIPTSTGESTSTEFIRFTTPAAAPARAAKPRAFLRMALVGIMLVSLLVMASVVIPDVYYRLMPEQVADVTTKQALVADTVIEPVATPTPVLPAVDLSLPIGEHLRIPIIGVDANVTASDNSEESLQQGAWMVPDFGRPTDFSQPTIIASHRYGWLWWWQSDFGRKTSFYYLPETKVGDQIEVITGQRRFVYEIYAKEEGQLISDYSADLILYTCKFLNSPERYFVYAKRLPATQAPTAHESQSGATAIFDKT